MTSTCRVFLVAAIGRGPISGRKHTGAAVVADARKGLIANTNGRLTLL
jgi:hypothetical protein